MTLLFLIQLFTENWRNVILFYRSY